MHGLQFRTIKKNNLFLKKIVELTSRFSTKSQILNLSLHEVAQELKQKRISPEDLINESLQQIEKFKHLNAFITINHKDKLMELARNASKKIDSGNAGLLEGIPICVKDNFCTEDMLTTCGSKMLSNFKPPYDATVVELLRKEGAIIIGKTNMDEFGMGSTSTLSYYGPVINPWSKYVKKEGKQEIDARIAGGSSGGSAVAVSSRMSFAGIGSDTGGSVRQPASYCGVIGMKPSYGRVSRYGLIEYASSLDTPGVFAKTTKDIALLLQILSGLDMRDSTSIDAKVPNYISSLEKNDLKGITIGIPREYHVKELPLDLLETWDKAASLLESLGAKVIEVSLENTVHALPAYYIIAPAEASSNLAKYDGIRYGFRASAENLQDTYEKTKAEGFGEEVKRRIQIGNFVLSRKSYESYYIQAQKVRRMIVKDFSRVFGEQKVDLLLTPTTLTDAFPISKSLSPVEMYINDIMTIPASLAGLPAASIPFGFSRDKLPIGVQLIGPYLGEQTILSVAKFLEQKEFYKLNPFGDQ